MYEKARWIGSVQEQQEEEETNLESESKQVKREAQLFKRHARQVKLRIRKKRRVEDAKRQEAFLDAAYQERLQQNSETEDEDDYDPIEDELEDDRQSFIDIMKHLLWLPSTAIDSDTIDEDA